MIRQTKTGLWVPAEPKQLCMVRVNQGTGAGTTAGTGGAQQAAAAGGGGGGAAYHPDDDLLDASMYAIAEAADLTEAGTGVDAWAWRNTGSTNIFKQGTDANRPTATAEGALGKPCLTFSGTTDLMLARNGGNSANINFADILGANSVGVIIAVVYASDVRNTSSVPYNNDTVLGDGSGGFGGIVLHSNGDNTMNPRAWAWDGTAAYDQGANKPEPGGAVLVWRRPDATHLHMDVNGTAGSGVTTGALTDTYGIQLGDAIGEEFVGELYLVAAFDTVPANLADIVSRLMTYYGIS